MPKSLPTMPVEHSRLDSISLGLAIVYVIMLSFPISLGQRFFLHDALLPAMGLAIVMRRRSLEHYLISYPYLLLFLSLSLLVTTIHACTAWTELYEWMVFAYQAVLFVFFAELTCSPRLRLSAAVILFTVTLLAFLYELTPLPSHFSFISPQMESTQMAFLARRFAFTQGNPNLFGVYYTIPCALATRSVAERDWSSVPVRQRVCLLLLPLLLMLPILSSASKHGIIPAALFLTWPFLLFPKQSSWLRPMALMALLTLTLVFEITVLYTTFPLTAKPPFITTEPGMYSLHQGTYVRLLTDRPHRLILGVGEQGARDLYPSYAQPDVVSHTLTRYNAMASYQNFITYMDPHQEYLNLITLFGLPAAMLICLFWITLPKQTDGRRRSVAIFFIAAVLAAALWDDVFSKRFLWVAAAILIPNTRRQKQHESTIP